MLNNIQTVTSNQPYMVEVMQMTCNGIGHRWRVSLVSEQTFSELFPDRMLDLCRRNYGVSGAKRSAGNPSFSHCVRSRSEFVGQKLAVETTTGLGSHP